MPVTVLNELTKLVIPVSSSSVGTPWIAVVMPAGQCAEFRVERAGGAAGGRGQLNNGCRVVGEAGDVGFTDE
ncbi:hypothetical protein AB0G15_27060 [Streptosporangium sp. NPDC023825]|uniref:hypothetical protein n=1 Tax=Streptosporangium sp. NPDC023825 TaxID=3154909 RepID=UPI003441EA33